MSAFEESKELNMGISASMRETTEKAETFRTQLSISLGKSFSAMSTLSTALPRMGDGPLKGNSDNQT